MLSLWDGASEDSYFNYEKIRNYRRLKNPETTAKNGGVAKFFYLLSVDVGRFNDQTVCCVFKVFEGDSGKLTCSLVNLHVLGREAETKTFYKQTIDIKRLIRDFSPREVVIDTNGLGVGIADELIREQIDEKGERYPPYGFFNDEKYMKIQPKNVEKILYGIKANSGLNSEIHSNAYARLMSGTVRFLITEQEAKSSLLSTKVGQKMKVEQRIKRLMPHEMTTRLLEEMCNLRLKKTGDTTKIALEKINSRFPKDKYSAFSYGLWRIKEIEEANLKIIRKRCSTGPRRLTFFN